MKKFFLSIFFFVFLSGCEVLAVVALVDAACDGDPECINEVADSMSSSSSNRDYDWDWDQFYDQYYNLVWRCRGIQTGQFADSSNCYYDYKDDDRWPGK